MKLRSTYVVSAKDMRECDPATIKHIVYTELTRSMGAAILQQHGAEVTSTVLPYEHVITYELQLYVYTKQQLEDYVQDRIEQEKDK